MATNVLPQALNIIPRNIQPCVSKKFGSFSTVVYGRPLSSFSSRVLQLNSSGFGLGRLKSDRSFVLLRAEARPDETQLKNVENEEEIEGSEAEVLEEKPRVKLGDIMGILNKRAIEESDKVRPRPDIRTGDVVEIKLEISEKWRYRNPAAQKHQKKDKKEYKLYKGIVISRQNAGIHTTIRVRRIIAGVGVEIVFPLYSPCIEEIKIVRHRKVRRARLYYLRDKLPRFSTFK